MQITLAELARRSGPDFPPLAWPRVARQTPPNTAAAAMLDALGRLAANRREPLLRQTVLVLSPRPEDWPAARLLACFGADVVFRGPTPPAWDADLYPRLFAALRHQLQLARPDLDAAPLRDVAADNFTRGAHFAAETFSERADADPLTGRCHLVLVIDLVSPGREDLARVVGRARDAARVGGRVEFLGVADGPEQADAVDWLVRSSAMLGLGVESGTTAETWPGPYRLSFSRLGDVSYEYPRGEDDPNAQVLAHCQARLRYAAHFVHGARVLEAGCGVGIGPRLFRAHGAASVLGLDYSADALTEARRLTADADIEYRQCDLNVTPLPLPSESFDVVVCMEVLEHVHHQEALLDEFHRVLRPGGRLVVSVPDKDYEDECARLNRCLNVYHVKVPDRQEFARLLGRFTQVRFARQIDFVGSTVVEDDAAPAGGGVTFPPGGLDLGTAETIMAVGTKAADEGANPAPAYAPRLYLFDNHVRTQLAWRREDESLRGRLAAAELAHWTDLNASAQAFTRLPSAEVIDDANTGGLGMVRSWLSSGKDAFAVENLAPGSWMARFAWLIRRAYELPPVPVDFFGPWEFKSVADGPRLRPFGLPQPPCPTVVYPRPEAHTTLGMIWRWRKRHVNEVWFLEDDGWKCCQMKVLLARRLFKTATRVLLPGLAGRLGLPAPETLDKVMVRTQKLLGTAGVGEVLYPLGEPDTDALWSAHIAATDARVSWQPPDGRRLRVVQYTGALYPGGAERQLCNVASGLAERDVDVRVLTTNNLDGERGHYRGLLRKAGIAVRPASKKAITPASFRGLPWRMLQGVPQDLAESVIALACELAAASPDVLHCWLDHPNLVGSLAGLIADVPAVVLSTRNVNPTHFPRFHGAYMWEWYRIAARSRRVRFIANSRAGAESYASWLGLPLDAFEVIHNGVCLDHFPQATAVNRARARAAFGLKPTDRVVVGAFRLADEKQPDVFLDVVRRVRSRVPNLRVLMAGAGDLEPLVREIIARDGLADSVRLLGRCDDVGTVLLAGDASLLTSKQEGCPNVALESQHLGVPMVATAAGGTADAIDHGHTGFVAAVDDAASLADHLTRILSDDALRARLAAAGPAFVAQRFGLDRMVDRTYELCGRALREVAGATAANRAA